MWIMWRRTSWLHSGWTIGWKKQKIRGERCHSAPRAVWSPRDFSSAEVINLDTVPSLAAARCSVIENRRHTRRQGTVFLDFNTHWIQTLLQRTRTKNNSSRLTYWSIALINAPKNNQTFRSLHCLRVTLPPLSFLILFYRSNLSIFIPLISE